MKSYVKGPWFALAAGLFVCLAAASAPVQAQTSPAKTYKVAGATIVIPPPGSGTEELLDSEQWAAKPFVEDDRHLITAYVDQMEHYSIHKGEDYGIHELVLVENLKSSQEEAKDESAEMFKTIIDIVTASMAGSGFDDSKLTEQDRLWRAHDLAQELKLIDTPVENARPLRTLFSKPNAWGLEQVVPSYIGTEKVNLIQGLVILRVKSRIITLLIYDKYEPLTLGWMRGITEEWADAILAANPSNDPPPAKVAATHPPAAAKPAPAKVPKDKPDVFW